jgi:putative ABC transport system permease protein
MLWNLAIRTLLYDRGKLIAGLVGVIFSVVLVNIQGGLFSGLLGKASLLVDRSGADIWVGHRGMHNVDFPHNIPIRWINRVRSIPGVREAEPMRIVFTEISLPEGGFESVAVVGVTEGSQLGRAFDIVEGPQDALDYPHSVIVDQCDDKKLLYPEIGEIREIGGRKVRVMGKCNGVLSFLVAPYIFTHHKHAAELAGTDPSMTSYFLVKLDEGADKQAVCREIEQRLSEVTVMPTDDYSATSVNFWMTRTGIGLSFGAATLMGLMVGLVMVGQTLYAMVLDRINEFATLKALGSTEKEIILLLTAQSSAVAAVGITLGTILSMLIRFMLSTPRTEINISIWLYVASATLVFFICLLASALPYLRVRRVDPHSVLQG